jgi:hypothetical protein
VTLFAGAWASSHSSDDSAFAPNSNGRKIGALDGPTDRRWVR